MFALKVGCIYKKKFENFFFNLDRKALLSRYPKANLAFMRFTTHSTPSVFHAEQCGMLGFWIRTLGPEFWGHPQPHGEPQHQQGQGLILEHIL